MTLVYYWPRSEKPLQTLGSSAFLSCSCFSIANHEAVSRSAEILLRIKALALQKGHLFALFALVGRTAAILDVAMLCAVEGAQCKTGNYLKQASESVNYCRGETALSRKKKNVNKRKNT